MKILVHHRIASRDGQTVHLEELVAALRRRGHDLIVVGPGIGGTDFGGSLGFVDWIKKVLPQSLYELAELAYNLPAFIRLARAVHGFHPDVIYERFNLFLLAGIMVHRLTGIPLLLEVNGPLFEERAKNVGLSLHRLARRCQKFLWNAADCVLPVTGVLAAIVRSYGVPDERIAIIPNGINPERFGTIPEIGAAKAALGINARIVLGFTGFVRQWHAMERVIDFVATHHDRLDLHFLLVGDGPVRDELIARARAKGVADRFTVTGVVARDEVGRYVAAFDIALQVGVTEYASPLKLFEYMYLERAIVAPATDNIREILTDGQDALLFDPTQRDALEAALLRLCEADDLRAQLAHQARLTIETKSLTWDTNAQRVVHLAEVLQRRGAMHDVSTRRIDGAPVDGPARPSD